MSHSILCRRRASVGSFPREVTDIMNRIIQPLVLLLAMALPALSVFAQSEPRYRELPNFHQVNRGLYRGAQPRKQGIEQLAALGIKTILNLRVTDDRTRDEEREARASGLNFFNIPMEGLDRPKHEQVARALEIINDPVNQPVFVHCKHGADRTGVVIAVYRMTHDGWTTQEALREAKRYGLSFFQFGMKDYINDYGRDYAGKPTGRRRSPLSVPEATRASRLAAPQTLSWRRMINSRARA